MTLEFLRDSLVLTIKCEKYVATRDERGAVCASGAVFRANRTTTI